LIGYNSKKIIYCGIKNKYCSICEKNKHPKEHKCYKKWSGSSTAMEQSIITERFR
jgi:hypothetical protein